MKAHINHTDNSLLSFSYADKLGVERGRYRYGFNGQEKIDEYTSNSGSHLDFGARIYDSRLGRFFSIDPLKFKYPWNSPYSYAINSPIKFVDDNGEGPDVIKNNSSSAVKLTGSSEIVVTTTDVNGNVTKKDMGEVSGSIVLQPGDVYYEVNEDVTIEKDGVKTTYSGGIGRIERANGTVEYVLINDVDYIDVEDGQSFEVDGKIVKNDANKEIDRNDDKGKRNNLPRKMVDGMPQEDIDGKNDTQDNLNDPNKQWIAKPNKGEIKFDDWVGKINLSDGANNTDGTKNVKVDKPGYWGNVETK